MDARDLRTYAAELLGTFVLVFVGTSAVVAAGRIDAPILLVAALAFGLALLAALYAFAEVSGGHFNPAVSLAMWLSGRLAPRDLAGYVVAQVLGAVLAGLVLLLATSEDEVAATATVPGADGSGTAFLMEVAMTAIFVAVILQASRSERFGSSALIAIPLTLTAVHLAAVPFSGASVNPARTLGSALPGTQFDGLWIYLTAPFAGAVIAYAVNRYVVVERDAEPESPVAEVLEGTDEARRSAGR